MINMDRIKQTLGLDDDTNDIWDNIDKECTCSLETRIMGFIGCFVLGTILSLFSTAFLFQVVTDPSRFAVLYTFGNILSIISAFFLSGPCKQLKSMFKLHRLSATIVYLGTLIVTLIAAFEDAHAGIVLTLIFIQLTANFYTPT